MKMKKISVALLAAMSLASAAAGAATSVATFSIATSPELTDLNKTVSFAGFNSSLGTLNSVTVELTSSLTGSVTVINLGSSGSTLANLDAALAFGVPGASGASVFYTGNVYSESLTVGSGFGSTVTYNIPSSGVTVTGSTTYTSGLSAFVSNGSLSAKAAVLAISGAEGGNGLAFDYTTLASASGKVIYNYTAAPVPEPETYGMLLAGLGLMGVVARRKAARNKA